MSIKNKILDWWHSHKAGTHSLAYRPDIDGLRAVAVTSVLGFHAFPLSLKGGFVGVDIFFVISGFLITSILLNHLIDHTFSLRAFYAARIRRIFPSLIFILIICLILGWNLLLPDEYSLLGKHVVAGAGFMSNLALWQETGYFDTSSETKPLLHLWSLGVEEQFYIFWPCLLWVTWHFKSKILTPLSLIAIASFAYNIAISRLDFTQDFYSPFCRFWELMCGAALSWAALKRETAQAPMKSYEGSGLFKKVFDIKYLSSPTYKHQRQELASLMGAIAVAYSIFFLTKKMIFPGWRALIPCLGTCCLIYGGPLASINRVVLSNRVFVGIGLISYPLYLWHWPLLSFAEIIYTQIPPVEVRWLLILLSFILAWATYLFIERPIRFGRRSSVVITWLLIVMIIIAGIGGVIWLQDGIKTRSIVLRNQFIETNAAENERIEEQFSLNRCSADEIPKSLSRYCTEFGPHLAKHTIVLWTDSHGGQDLYARAWSPVFYTIAREKGDTRVIRFSLPGCPPIINIRRSDGLGNAGNCSDLDQGSEIVHTIMKLHPEHVVLIARWSMSVNGNHDMWGVLQKDTHFITSGPGEATADTAREAMIRNLPATLELLSRQTDVLIIKNFPVLRKPINSVLAMRLPFDIEDKYKNIKPTLAEHLELSALPFELIDEAAKKPHVRVFDPTPFLCDTVCGYIKDGIVMYTDDNHPSVYGALQFQDPIKSLLYSPDPHR